MALQFLHIDYSDVRSHSSAHESNKQNPRDRTLDLPFFFCFKHIPPLENLPSPAPNESLPYWFQGDFAASFVLKLCLREFLLSAFANRFEHRHKKAIDWKRTMRYCSRRLFARFDVERTTVTTRECKFLIIIEAKHAQFNVLMICFSYLSVVLRMEIMF